MTDQEVLTQIQYNLVEPPDGGQSWLSGLWTRDEVLAALNTRARQFLRDTQAVTKFTQIAVTLGTDPIVLPDDWIATLAANWRLLTGERTTLTTGDVFEADLAAPTWSSTGGSPLLLLDDQSDTLTCRLAPVPDVDGVLELLYVALPVTATGANVDLEIPDELLDQMRYGTLADLLGKVGRGNDPMRADYCQERFELGEMLTEMILRGWA